MKREKVNPRLKAAMMEVVENQIRDNEPPETRQTLDRLVAEGISEEDAKLYIGQAIAIEIWTIIRNQKQYDHKRYLQNLARLPKRPREKYRG